MTDMAKVSAKLEDVSVLKDKKKEEATNSERKRGNYLYLKEHFKVTSFIMESGCKLRLSAVTVSTACVLYHRFWIESVSLCKKEDFDAESIGTAVLFLASKAEESPRKLRDVINVCYKTTHKNVPFLEVGNRYWELRDSIVNCELLVLRVLAFKVDTDKPHKYLLHYLKSLQDWVEPDAWRLSQVTQLSWSILRDSYHIPIILKYPPSHVAIAVIYFAILCTGMQVPSHEAQKTWWKAMCDTATEKELQDITEDIMDLYDFESKPL
ncbi:cyclin-Q-like [Actinia tenebrosa]|uniref:Cyclin-Q n=1 Tax=Actinia tenebrosa TaxID=6105 RepID=A0A6P8I1A4_ACTTE|nr:cyclin-Q-like [Actinia tenebrosa]